MWRAYSGISHHSLCNVYKDNTTIKIIMEQQDLQTMLTDLAEKLALVQTTSKDTIVLSKKLAKEVTKLSKAKPVKKVKGASPDGKKTQSGFAKPTKLSPELYTFLGIADTELLSRTDVTRHINKYVKDNNLQKPDERKVILPDEKLGKLLNIPDDVTLTYFNLQRYMKHLFITASSA